MTIMEETDSRFTNLEKKVGLFVVIALAAIGMTIVYIGVRQDLFSAKVNLHLVSKNGRGINQGQPVKLSGFTIGKVKRISLNDSATVNVTLSINRSYMKWIRTDSKARLVQEGVIGENIIEITPGAETGQRIEKDETLTFERAVGLNEMFEELDDIKAILKEIKEGGLKESFANMNQLSGELLGAREHFDTFLDSAEQTVDRVDALVGRMESTTTRTDRAMEKMNSLAESANRVSAEAEKSFPVILDNMVDATEDIKRVSEQAPAIVTKGGDLIDDTGAIIDSVEKTWPIRSHIHKPGATYLEADSYE